MIKTMHRVAIYLRISTFEQTTANQERELSPARTRSYLDCHRFRL
jgi:DNA invertase Pin-like site-specific DNA recombinase